MARLQIRCATLFTGLDDEPLHDHTLLVEDGRITALRPTNEVGPPMPGEQLVDAGEHFVMPGLVDVHTHVVFGNAKSEEDIDLHSSPEFRALRGLFFVQHVLAAGYTSVLGPGDAGEVSISIRNAIEAGLFDGPRVGASSNVIANRQSLNDFFPSWVGTPEYFTGRLCTSAQEGIAEIRRQAKQGVDVVKIAMDGTHFRELHGGTREHIAAFTQDETRAMVDEAHRLGRKVATHAYGREAVLYAARAGVDVIFHAFFSQPRDPSVSSGFVATQRRVIEAGCRILRRTREAGVPFMTGSDSGFAVTRYGEWHAREIEILVDWLGFTPAQALRAATSVSARMLPRGRQLGALVPGGMADFIFVAGNPVEDVTLLQRREAIRAAHIGGRRMETAVRGYDPNKVSNFNTLRWTDLYTRDRVAALRAVA